MRELVTEHFAQESMALRRHERGVHANERARPRGTAECPPHFGADEDRRRVRERFVAPAPTPPSDILAECRRNAVGPCGARDCGFVRA